MKTSLLRWVIFGSAFLIAGYILYLIGVWLQKEIFYIL